MKKCLSLLLALWMLTGLAAPAWALDIPGGVPAGREGAVAEAPLEGGASAESGPVQPGGTWSVWAQSWPAGEEQAKGAPAEAVDTWAEVADTAWYDAAQTEYRLATARQLAGLAALVNDQDVSFAGKTVYLENDVDLAGREWVAVGNGGNTAKYFTGTFDGQGHCVRNLTVENSQKGHGFFGVVQQAVIRDFGVVDARILPGEGDSSIMRGILAAWALNSTVKNCYTTGVIQGTKSGAASIGGLIGFCVGSTQIIGCYSSAKITCINENTVGDGIGGIVGTWEEKTGTPLISDCWFDGSIAINSPADDPAANIGGILGMSFADIDPAQDIPVRIENCMVATKDVVPEEYGGTFMWLAWYERYGVPQNCYWPEDSREYPASIEFQKLIDGDSDFLHPVAGDGCGSTVSDFMDPSVLAGLQTNAAPGVNWVKGRTHPTFDWDTRNADTGPEPAPIVPDTGLTLDKTALNLEPGETAKLKTTLSPADATYKYIFWQSSDEAVATVSDSGLVTALEDGVATITAKSWYGHTATCEVTVKTPPTPPPTDPWPTEGLAGFVTRCYRVALGRDPDKAGHADWVRWLKDGTVDATSCTYGFVFSREMNDKKLGDKAFVETLYKLFMNREGEAAGITFWVGYLKAGHSREEVFYGFTDSIEFARIKASYGIR